MRMKHALGLAIVVQLLLVFPAASVALEGTTDEFGELTSEALMNKDDFADEGIADSEPAARAKIKDAAQEVEEAGEAYDDYYEDFPEELDTGTGQEEDSGELFVE